MSDAERRRPHHDMGGEPAGPVTRSEHEPEPWEKQVDALVVLLSHPDRALLRVDELRRGIESLGPDAYDRLAYYERWIESATAILVEKGVLDRDALDARIEVLRARAGDDA